MDNEARALLSDLVKVLDRLERCSTCVAPLSDSGVDECHRKQYEQAIRKAKRFLAKKALN
jgi:hypothetical protein